MSPIRSTRFMVDITQPSQTIRLQQSMSNLKGLDLYAYSIKGAPTTGGVPDNLYYNLNFPDIPLLTWKRSDQKSMPIIACEGSFTHDHLQPIVQLLPEGTYPSLSSFRVEITNPDGTPGTFTEIILLMIMHEEH